VQSESLVAPRVSPLFRTPALISYRSLIWNFAKRDLKSRFKGTTLGWAWSMLLPLATLGTYTVMTHFIFRIKPLPFADGRAGNYAVFLFVGLTAWGIFSNAVNTAMPALLSTGPLMKKIYFPAYAPVLGAVIGVLIQSAIEVGLVLAVLCAFQNVGITWVLVPLWFALYVTFTASCALIFSIGNIYFRDLAHLVNVFLQLLFYMTPVLYVDTLLIDHPALHKIIMANPLSQYVILFRDMLYSLRPGTVREWLLVVGWAVVALLLAMFVFHKFGRDLGEEV
jgi:ABC-type polysaccharide/polyol phosphate export permease